MSNAWRAQFTENELLYERISEKRMREIIAGGEVRGEPDVSPNSYGEFLFLTVKIKGTSDYVTFYGLGEHERSGRIKRDFGFYADSQSWGESKPPYNNARAIQAVIARRREIESWDEPKRTAEHRAYEFIAELADEDGAISELEDHPEITDLFGEE